MKPYMIPAGVVLIGFGIILMPLTTIYPHTHNPYCGAACLLMIFGGSLSIFYSP